MIYTFSIAYDFNQDLSNWDVSNVTSMNGCLLRLMISIKIYLIGMFQMLLICMECFNTAFNQDISS